MGAGQSVHPRRPIALTVPAAPVPPPGALSHALPCHGKSGSRRAPQPTTLALPRRQPLAGPHLARDGTSSLHMRCCCLPPSAAPRTMHQSAIAHSRRVAKGSEHGAPDARDKKCAGRYSVRYIPVAGSPELHSYWFPDANLRGMYHFPQAWDPLTNCRDASCRCHATKQP